MVILSSVPSSLPATDRTVVLGDLHGDREIFIGILMGSKCIIFENSQMTWTGGNTIVVCMGDTTDGRRPDTLDCDMEYEMKAMERELQIDIVELDKKARSSGGRVISILGNHDIYAGTKMYKDYSKPADNTSYPEGRTEAYKPGNSMAYIFGKTRNVVQIVGKYLFVHGSLVPEMLQILPGDNVTKRIEHMNRTMSSYLMGKTSMPRWFTDSSSEGVNPVECRRYAEDHRRGEVKELLSYIPGVRLMVIGHTPCDHVSRKGSVICTDVALSRAFGHKRDVVVAEYLEINREVPYRVKMYMNGRLKKTQLR